MREEKPISCLGNWIFGLIPRPKSNSISRNHGAADPAQTTTGHPRDERLQACFPTAFKPTS
ncbi:hypothetical protein HDF12_004249 [Edaphobacter lichenicola]|uniref:Uncharacterized protein n=1 Tax=Tunturiibacter lichenicola TaxID=2051959 RepID=A0A7Y9TC87_9BACT|nr:hypothetical protein [Edaphobacter lichenicola]